MITSPNYPGYYPNDLKKTETIQVEQGLVISLKFDAFNIQTGFQYDYDTNETDYDSPTCNWDHLTITDGDGTTLMEKSCGGSSFAVIVIGGQSIGSSLPTAITSRSNTIKLVFTTDGSYSMSGWRVSWRAVAGINHQPS